MGFVGWLLNALLLLEIIVSMKRCYVGILGNIEKCIHFAGVFLRVLKIKKGHTGWIGLGLSKTQEIRKYQENSKKNHRIIA